MGSLASPRGAEWEKSQQVEISADLVAVAKQELRFLQIVDGAPALKDEQVLERAIERYLNCWLPLARECDLSTRLLPPLAKECDFSTRLLPPLDCAWVWHCHKLNPVQYAKDCQQLFGCLVDVRGPEPSREHEVEALSVARWEKLFPIEPYHFLRAGQRPAVELPIFVNTMDRKSITYDLLGAIQRQSSFYFQVCRPWMQEDRFLQKALARYRGFLYLNKLAVEKERQGGPTPFVVPAYDIDLLWHSHQLCPIAYRADTIKCVGKVLNHDDTDSNRESGAKLQTSFVETCEQWLDAFGTVYEHAGSLYRGPGPAKVVPPTPHHENQLAVVTGYPVEQEQQPLMEVNNRLSARQTLQVNLVIMGADGLCPTQKPGRKSHFYVRVTALRRCPGMKLTTNPMECSTSAEVMWNKGFSLQAELATQGLRMELMTYTTKKSDDGYEGWFQMLQRRLPGGTKKPKCLGEVSIDWERDLLRSVAGLSFTQKVCVVPTPPKDSSTIHRVLPQLHFSVSITPPTPAPFIFRMLEAPVSDDTGLQVARKLPEDQIRQEGRWITKTVVDHRGQEQFVVRARWATGVRQREKKPERVSAADAVINVHQGRLERLGRKERRNYQGQHLVRTPRHIVTSAKQLPVGAGATSRVWSLCGSAAFLNVSMPANSHDPLNCRIQGDLGYPMRLLSGRWLEYEVDARGMNPSLHGKEEAKYLTLVRYTPDSPTGKATALINWQSAAIEVKPEESVALVVLIATAINVSLVDMKFDLKNIPKLPPWVGRWLQRRHSLCDGHLGAMLIQRNGLSDLWSGYPSNRDMYWERHNALGFYYLYWYEMSTTDVYGSGAAGAVCGGGACGGGGCGGGNCGGGAGCGGGGGCGGGCGG